MLRADQRRRWLLAVGCVLGFFACGWSVGVAKSKPARTFVRIADTALTLAPVPTVSLAGVPESLRLDEVSGRVMVFALSPECPFCEQNMPRWRRLAGVAGGAAGARTIVLSTSESEAARRFLSEHGLTAPAWTIDESALDRLGAPAVPATIAVDPESGRVHRWIGVLDDDLETALIAWIRTGAVPR